MSDYIVNPPSSSCSGESSSTSASITSQITYNGGARANIPITNNVNLNSVINNIDAAFLTLRNQVADSNKLAQDANNNASSALSASTSLTVDDISDPTTYTTLTPSSPNLENTLKDIDTRLGAVVSLTASQSSLLSLQPFLNKHITKGFVFDESNDFDISGVSGLSANIAAGYVISENGDIASKTGETKAFTANKDTYVYLNASTNQFVYKEVSVGASAPSITNDEVILYKITTDATTISGQTNLREKGFIDESFFRLGTDVSNFIPNDSITNAKINMSSVLVYDSAHTLSLDTHIAHKKYVDDSVAGISTSLWTDGTTNISYSGKPVGIGTASPASSTVLHVNGTFRLSGSGESNGRILECNADGDASWKSISSMITLQKSLDAGSTATATSDVSITRDGASFDSILLLSDTIAKLEVNNGANSNKIEIQGGSMVITDGINSKGLQYASATYRTSFTSESLVDKGYVDSATAGAATYVGGYNASTNTPDLDTSPSGIKKGDMYTVTADGTFYTVALKSGDFLIAEQDNPTQADHWTIVEKNLTFGINNGNSLLVDGTVVSTDYAKFTANGLEGKSTSEVKTDLSLNNVENTALSTWAGSTSITTLGTIGTGVWQGTPITDAYIATDYVTATSGAAQRIAVFDGTDSVDGDSNFLWNNYLQVTSSSPEAINITHNAASGNTTNAAVDVFLTTGASALNSYGVFGRVNGAAGGTSYGGFFYTDRSATGNSAFGVYGKVGGSGDIGNASYGGFHYVQSSGAYNSGGTIHGSKAQVTIIGTGTHTSTAYGVASALRYEKTAGTTTLNTAIGFSWEGATVSAGTITSSYGIYLGDNTISGTGAITNKYGVFQVGADNSNYFAGNVGIALLPTTYKLEVGGQSKFNGTIFSDTSSDAKIKLYTSTGANNNRIEYNTDAGAIRGYHGFSEASVFTHSFSGVTVNFAASAFNVNSTGNIGINADGVVTLQSGGSNAIVANSSQIVSIPNGHLSIASDESYPIRIEGTRQNVAYSFHNGATVRASIGYGQVSSTNSFNIQNNENSPIRLYTNGAERIKIEASGNVDIKESLYIRQTSGTAPVAGQFLKAINAQGQAEWATVSTGGATDINGLSDATTPATDNIGLGSGALDSITTGDYNTAVGINAGTSLTAGQRNVFIGNDAGKNITNNIADSVAIGEGAMGVGAGANTNIAIGANALSGVSGQGNVGIGNSAGSNITTGTFNTVIGRNANAVANLSYQIAIGQQVETTISSSLVVGRNGRLLLHGEFGTAERAKLGVNLGNTYVTPLANLHVKGHASDGVSMLVQDGTGSHLFQVNQNGDVDIDNGNLIVAGQLYSPMNNAGNLQGSATAPNFDNGNVQYYTITANTTLNAPTNIKEGASYTLVFVQGGSGGYNITFNAAYNFGSAGAPDLTIGAVGDRLYVTFICFNDGGLKLDAIFSGIKH